MVTMEGKPLPRHAAVGLSLLLGAVLHLDWHIARPLHYRLSLEWSHHWIVTATIFAIIGCLIARLWPDQRWRLGTIVFLGAAIVAQVIEPVLEVLVYDHRLGYDGEPARWVAFSKSIVAGAVAYFSTLWLCAPKPSVRDS